MTDIHAHILPGIDDGAPDMDAAIEMAAMAVESGVKTIVATPHCMDFAKRQNLWDSQLQAELSAFRRILTKEKIPLEILPGMEIFGTPQVPDLIRQGKMIGINNSDYMLIEFAFHNYASQATEILEQILALGKRPVIAHPERYIYVQKDPSILNMWTEMGCLMQINKGSLLGAFGNAEQQLAYELVDRGFAFCVASDAHSPMRRTTWMKDVQRLLRQQFSPSAAQMLLETNPAKIIRNENIRWDNPHWFR